ASATAPAVFMAFSPQSRRNRHTCGATVRASHALDCHPRRRRTRAGRSPGCRRRVDAGSHHPGRLRQELPRAARRRGDAPAIEPLALERSPCERRRDRADAGRVLRRPGLPRVEHRRARPRDGADPRRRRAELRLLHCPALPRDDRRRHELAALVTVPRLRRLQEIRLQGGSRMSNRRSCVRGGRFGLALFVVLWLIALALPAASTAVVNIEGQTPEPLPDFDARASVAPAADQLAAARALGADVSWNRFGVASAVSRNGNYVTRGLQAPDAVSAARKWLDANKELFRLDSTDSLAVATTQPLVGTTNDYAIVFHQVADGVASTDGFPTVALVGSKADGWNVVYASSSLTGGSTDATGSADLTPAVAWTQAANEAGVDVSVVDITAQSTTGATTALTVDGLAQQQQVKKAVF